MNRLGKYLDKDEDQGGRPMEDKRPVQDNYTFENVQEDVKKCSGYLIAVTFLDKGMLTHHLLTNSFPTGDIEIAMRELGKLAADTKKASENTNEPTK